MNGSARTVEKSAGLFWGTGSEPASHPVPLEGVKVHGDIRDHASRVTLAQRFRNAEKVPIEAVYVFPLPEAAAVCGLAVRVGDRRIEGVVDRRDKAFDTYDDAMEAGHGAVLLDEERPNVFTLSVGNILPGQEVSVELSWVAELSMEGEAIRFVVPTAVAPRYAPNEDLRGVSPTPAERVSPPIALDVPYGFELSVDVSLSSGLRAADSPSHPVRVEMDGARARVTLSHERAAMDRDFVLLITPRDGASPRVLVEKNDDGLVTAAVSFVPQLECKPTPAEVVFLVDRSGSMAGSSIEQVRAALQLCLRSLRAGDFFNIVGFGSSFEMLFPESVAYGQETMATAAAHVAGLDADLGGTEILPALASVLGREPRAGLRRQLVLLTDGEVSNEAAVIELAEAHGTQSRIFTFGIGHGASEYLVRSLARVTRGQAEFIHPGERIEPKVLRQFARLGMPAVRDVKVEWTGAVVTLQAPYRAPAVFNGEAAVVYARVEAGAAATVTLSGDAEGMPVRWSVPVDLGAARPGTLLATLAARAAIRDLEEGTSALHARARGSAQRGRREKRVAEAIVKLALAHHLASSETSFVAVERREAAGEQPAAELRRVPVQLTAGWGGSRLAAGALAAQVHAMAALGAHVRYDISFRAASPDVRDRLSYPGLSGPAEALGGDEDDRSVFSRIRPSACRPSRTAAAPPPDPQRPHVAVALLQQADGSWVLNRALADAIGVSLRRLTALAKTVGRDEEAGVLVATLAALRFLEAKGADARDEWRLLALKAEVWLERAFAVRPGLDRGDLERRLASLA